MCATAHQEPSQHYTLRCRGVGITAHGSEIPSQQFTAGARLSSLKRAQENRNASASAWFRSRATDLSSLARLRFICIFHTSSSGEKGERGEIWKLHLRVVMKRMLKYDVICPTNLTQFPTAAAQSRTGTCCHLAVTCSHWLWCFQRFVVTE